MKTVSPVSPVAAGRTRVIAGFDLRAVPHAANRLQFGAGSAPTAAPHCGERRSGTVPMAMAAAENAPSSAAGASYSRAD